MSENWQLIVNAVTAWNPAIGEALQQELSTIKRGGDERFRTDLNTMLTLALQSLDRNPAATRANLQNALELLRS